MEQINMMNRDTFTSRNLLLQLGFVFLIIIAGYSLFQAKNLILGPQITISEPVNGSSVSYEVFTIRGIAKNISSITLNDSPIFIDESGVFKEKLIAPPGYSIMAIRASDRFGRKTVRYIHLMNTSPTVPPLDTPELISPEEPLGTTTNQS